jgi:hypothetical protein
MNALLFNVSIGYKCPNFKQQELDGMLREESVFQYGFYRTIVWDNGSKHVSGDVSL